jgi:hypothetical protein
MGRDWNPGRASAKWMWTAVLLVPCISGTALAAQQSPGNGPFDKRLNPLAAMSAPRPSLGELHGSVFTTDKTPLAGAQVKLIKVDHSILETSTASDGSFHFQNLRPGTFTLQTSLPGFTPASTPVSVLPHDSPVIDVQMSPIAVTVEVVASTQDVAEAQLHFEETQRLAGIIPNFYVSYDWNAAPLTAKQKFSLAFHNIADPGNLLLVGTVAGAQQATDTFNGYGQGAAGYGRRYGADLGNLVSGTLVSGAILPSLFHQDPRYFYKGTGSVGSRLRYALSSVVVCRGDDGHRQPAFSTIFGDMSAGAISNLYYDRSDRRGASLTIANGLLGIAGDAMNDVFQEFILPRLTRRESSKSKNP